ncbi:MAG: adenosine kinase [Alphaproteobacteria bacterium]|nr:MAG: adenosine kinase [Alphaproteobacteria bacterium]
MEGVIMIKKQYDVVGIGNAIVDILAHVEESFLKQHTMEKGGMQLVDSATIAQLHAQMPEARQCSGGSVANTIAALADLNMKVGFIGKVGADDLGKVFIDDLTHLGVATTIAVASPEGAPTACCAICVTNDGERTMNTYIGASADLIPSDVHSDLLEQASILYVEGYLWDKRPAREAITYALEKAKAAGAKIAFSLSDTFCVDRHREEFLHLIHNYVDIVFSNEDEALSLFCLAQAHEAAADYLKTPVETFIITRGSQPALIGHKGVVTEVQGVPIDHVEDATGAGDLFAAGFLYGLAHEQDIEQSARYGHSLASHIIQQIGARSNESLRLVLQQ